MSAEFLLFWLTAFLFSLPLSIACAKNLSNKVKSGPNGQQQASSQDGPPNTGIKVEKSTRISLHEEGNKSDFDSAVSVQKNKATDVVTEKTQTIEPVVHKPATLQTEESKPSNRGTGSQKKSGTSKKTVESSKKVTENSKKVTENSKKGVDQKTATESKTTEIEKTQIDKTQIDKTQISYSKKPSELSVAKTQVSRCSQQQSVG